MSSEPEVTREEFDRLVAIVEEMHVALISLGAHAVEREIQQYVSTADARAGKADSQGRNEERAEAGGSIGHVLDVDGSNGTDTTAGG